MLSGALFWRGRCGSILVVCCFVVIGSGCAGGGGEMDRGGDVGGVVDPTGGLVVDREMRVAAGSGEKIWSEIRPLVRPGSLTVIDGDGLFVQAEGLGEGVFAELVRDKVTASLSEGGLSEDDRLIAEAVGRSGVALVVEGTLAPDRSGKAMFVFVDSAFGDASAFVVRALEGRPGALLRLAEDAGTLPGVFVLRSEDQSRVRLLRGVDAFGDGAVVIEAVDLDEAVGWTRASITELFRSSGG